MLYIAHRGNLSGPNPSRENQPSYIQEALNEGYNVEFDLWLIKDTFYLGHDKPEYIINYEFLLNTNMWIHCKNLAALDELILEPDINCFYHNTDSFTLTSKVYIWTYPNIKNKITQNSIAVLPEHVKNWDISKAAGLCTDYVLSYQKMEDEGKI